MPALLFNATAVRLFGHPVEGLSFDAKAATGDTFKALLTRLDQSGDNKQIALIYAFSVDGEYYDLDRPALFTVWGDPKPASSGVDATGIALNDREFAPDLQVWTFDRSDVMVRFDVDVGTIEDLLEPDYPDEDELSYRGKNVRSSGKNVRLRFGGKNVRLRGGGLSD
ncbi:MAG: hypothetical protein U1E45_01720 [Geminicoccaceae bacterium]